MINVAQKLENLVQLVVGWSFHSSAIENVDHDAMWLTQVNEVQQPGSTLTELFDGWLRWTHSEEPFVGWKYTARLRQ